SICHGAGRKFSRSAAKEVLSIDSFRASMKIGEADEIVMNHIAPASRAWGGMGSEYFTSKATEYMQSYDLGTGDPNIKFLPFHSGLG
ncbi:hypothetical protein, partial [Bacillus cereus]